MSSYLEEPESKNTETHVSYLWRFNLILSYLFLRSSVGFRFCICPNLVVVRHSLVQNQRQSIKECRLLTQSTLVFSCFDLHNTIDSHWLSVKDPMIYFAFEALLLDSILIPPIFCWQLTQYSRGQEAAAVAKQKTKENPPGIAHCWQNQHLCFQPSTLFNKMSLHLLRNPSCRSLKSIISK